jgi:hypothetical protein
MAKHRDEQSKILQLLSENPSISAACKKLGLSRMTFHRWYKGNLEFRERVDAALVHGRSFWIEIAELGIVKHVKEGNLNAQKYFLAHNDPRYSPKLSLEALPSPLQKDQGASLRGQTPMPETLNSQWENLEKLGMLTQEELPAPDTAALETVQEEQEAEADKAEAAESIEKEKEAAKQRELDDINLNLERARAAQRQSWPDQALAFPLEVRIQKYRETWGKGEEAADWDMFWDQNKGNKNPSPI